MELFPKWHSVLLVLIGLGQALGVYKNYTDVTLWHSHFTRTTSDDDESDSGQEHEDADEHPDQDKKEGDASAASAAAAEAAQARASAADDKGTTGVKSGNS